MKHFLSVCLIVKSKFPHELIQWVLWHKFIGVDHFYIYDDGCDFDLKDALKKFEASITYVKKGNEKRTRKKHQIFIYEKVFNKYKNCSKWMAFIDEDEYIFSPNDKNFLSFLLKYEDCDQINLIWRMFSPAGKVKNQTHEKLILGDFNYYKLNRFTKSIVNCESKNVKVKNQHDFLETGKKVDCFGKNIEIIHQQCNDCVYDNPDFIINHYSFISVENIFYKTFERGEVNFNNDTRKIKKLIRELSSLTNQEKVKEFDFKKSPQYLKFKAFYEKLGFDYK